MTDERRETLEALEQGGSTASDVAEWRGCSMSAAYAMMAAMEREGLVERVSRGRYMLPTPERVGVLARVADMLPATVEQVAFELGTSEAVARRALGRLARRGAARVVPGTWPVRWVR